jgi:RNA polymerase sigma-70 factor (ECF subfamily)
VLTDIKTCAKLLGAVKDVADARAWLEFDKVYRPAIYTACRRLGLDFTDAGALTQEVLKKVAGALTGPAFTYDPRRRFRGWLRTVIKNAVADFYREREKRRDRALGGTDNLLHLGQVPDSRAPDPNALSDSLSEHIKPNGPICNLVLLREAISRVRNRLRNKRRWDAAWGVIAEDRPTREVARELGMSVAAVGTAVNEVLDMLKQEMENLRRADEEGPEEKPGDNAG